LSIIKKLDIKKKAFTFLYLKQIQIAHEELTALYQD